MIFCSQIVFVKRYMLKAQHVCQTYMRTFRETTMGNKGMIYLGFYVAFNTVQVKGTARMSDLHEDISRNYREIKE